MWVWFGIVLCKKIIIIIENMAIEIQRIVLIGATGAISKSAAKGVPEILGRHSMSALQ